MQAITAAKVKTDSADSLTLLKMLRLDLGPEAHVISPELRELRDLLRRRMRLIEERTSLKNSIARLLEKYNRASVEALPELARVQARFHRGQLSLLAAQIKTLEKRVERELKPNPVVRRLRRITLRSFVLMVRDDAVSVLRRRYVVWDTTEAPRRHRTRAA